MLRALVLAAGLGLVGVAAAPASAGVTLVCFSHDTRCQVFRCSGDEEPLVREGYEDTGPWLVICDPR